MSLRAAEHKLLRILGAGFAVAVVVGAVIGVGILRIPGEVAAHLASAPLVLAMWLAGGIYALLAAVSVTELGTMLPETGGYFVFSRRAFGDAVGFTVGWTDWIGQTSSIAYASVAFGEFFAALFPSFTGRDTMVAVAVIAAFGALQWCGIRASSRVQQITSLLKAVAFLALVAACFLFGGGKPAAPQPPRTETLFVAIILAAQAIILTYDGWYEALYFTEEIKDPVRHLPRSMIGGVALVIVIYTLVNAALVYVLPLGELASSKLPAATAAERLFGPASGSLITILSLISLPPMINAVMLCAPRILFAMARAGLVPQPLAVVSRRGNPEGALLLTIALAAALAASGTFRTLIAVASVVFIVNHCFALTALFVLRRREPDLPRPFRAWGYPWISAGVLLAAAALVAGSFYSDPRHSLYAAALIAASFPVYRAFRSSI